MPNSVTSRGQVVLLPTLLLTTPHTSTPSPPNLTPVQVLRPFMLRRLKETVATELPQKREHLLPGVCGGRC